jgi:hypothetical protein
MKVEQTIMYTLTFQTKYTFGQRIRFDSRMQGRSGIGTIFAITVDAEGKIDYTLSIMDEAGYSDLQPGIYEEEIISVLSIEP